MSCRAVDDETPPGRVLPERRRDAPRHSRPTAIRPAPRGSASCPSRWLRAVCGPAGARGGHLNQFRRTD